MNEENIKEFTTGENPGHTLEAQEIDRADIPPWLNVDHPEFPKFFIFAKLNRNGETVRWWERRPPQ
jgi:hypothetical protein